MKKFTEFPVIKIDFFCNSFPEKIGTCQNKIKFLLNPENFENRDDWDKTRIRIEPAWIQTQNTDEIYLVPS
jgi:hypothetical protein